MSVMSWVMVAAFVAAILFVGLGFAAFWPPWPPLDNTPLPEAEEPKRPRRYRGRRALAEADTLDGDEVPYPPARIDLAGQEEPLRVAPEEWMWRTTGAGKTTLPMPILPPRSLERRAMHRHEHLGEGTQPLRWPLPPEEDEEPTQ
jgi:hypothetical protein